MSEQQTGAHPRELYSTTARVGHVLGISYADADALIRAVGLALERLCPLYAAWVLLHAVRRRFGRAAAVAAAAGALMCACGRVDADSLLDCAERRCGGGPGVRTSDADAVAAVAREVGDVLGLHFNTASHLAGYLKYMFLQSLGAPMLDLDGRGAVWGELIAYACHIRNGEQPPSPTAPQG